MGREVSPFYTENPTVKVPYAVVWKNSDFAYNQEFKKRLPEWISMVTSSQGETTASSLPTGGRNLVYNLKNPFTDPITNLPCTQVDVKGIGFTRSGFARDGAELGIRSY